jgi:AraC family transcriptional activator of pobA
MAPIHKVLYLSAELEFSNVDEFIDEIRRLLERLAHSTMHVSARRNHHFISLPDKFRACVRKNIRAGEMAEEARFVNFYAEQLCVHPNHLSAVVKRETGNPALTFIHSQIIEEAKLLLLESEMSVKQIAYRLAFKEPSHFNAFFRKHTDITPATFRKHAWTESQIASSTGPANG